MHYLILEDAENKALFPILVPNSLNPEDIQVKGKRVLSGGQLSVSPDARISTSPSEKYRFDAGDTHWLGKLLQGESEFKRRDPILLFKLPTDNHVKAAYSIPELLETPGFPDQVTWVSRAGSAFDRFFVSNPDGSISPKSKETDVVQYVEDSDQKEQRNGLLGSTKLDLSVRFKKSHDIYGDRHDTSVADDDFRWRFDAEDQVLYWWLEESIPEDVREETVSYLAEKGFHVIRQVNMSTRGLPEPRPKGKSKT